MTEIVLLSDTHNFLDEKVLKHVREADEVWHAGDVGTIAVCQAITELKPLRAVYGNIDGQDIRKEYPEHLRFACEQVSVYMTHIGGYPGKYSPAALAEIQKDTPKLFICGHSHILKVQFDQKYQVMHMNPGAAGISGFHQVRTLLRFKVDKDKIIDLRVVEMGKRA